MSDIMPNELKWWWGYEKPEYDTITTTESLSCDIETNITTEIKRQSRTADEAGQSPVHQDTLYPEISQSGERLQSR